MSKNYKEKTFISAVIYVHNQEKSIAAFLDMLFNVLSSNFEKFEIICVNDSSNDKSVKIIEEVAGKFTHAVLSILHMSYYHGLELAMKAGVDLSIGDFVYEFDSIDTCYNEDMIMGIYYKSLEGYDIVSAVPDEKQKLSSKLFYKVFNKFTFDQYDVTTEKFRILSRRVINRVDSMNITIPYRKAVYANCGLAQTKMKFEMTSQKTTDKMELKYRKNLAIDVLILFTDLGYKCSLGITIGMMLIAILAAVYAITVFCLGIPVAGWTTTILFLAISFFALFAIITIVIKYLAVLVDLVLKKQRYTISGIQKITK